MKHKTETEIDNRKIKLKLTNKKCVCCLKKIHTVGVLNTSLFFFSQNVETYTP